MRFKQNLLQIIGIFSILSCFSGPNVLCDEDRDLKHNEETEVVKIIDKCGNWDERSPAPWTVTIYNKFYNPSYDFLYRCIGSIVSPNLIISAAQCYMIILGTALDPDEYYVVVGMHNTDFEKVKYSEANHDHVKVKEIRITPGYRKLSSDYSGNLAVLVLEKPLQITDLVQPVCFDRNNKIESEHRLHNNHETEGWNIDQYQYTEVNATDMIDLHTCFQLTSENFYRASCRTVTGGPAVCRNFGGGIILKYKQQFYIRGVIGYAPTTKRDGCDPDLQYGVFTNISDNHEFVLSIIDDYKIKIGDCPSLKIIDHGEFEFLGQKQSNKLGTPVRNYAVIKFTCYTNYALRPMIPVVTCIDGNFTNPIPQCKRILKGAADEIINVIDECGYWDENPPAPWNVAVYHHGGTDNYEFYCGGSIITANVIITAATCFADKHEYQYVKLPAEEFYVAAGKFYKDYNNTEEEFSQKSQVKEYHIPPEFNGGYVDHTEWFVAILKTDQNDFRGNLAVVVLKHPFHMTNVVQPVCLDRNNKIESRQVTPNNTGIVTAWDFVFGNGINELKQLNTTYIINETCVVKFSVHYTSDKFCADYITCGKEGGGIAYKWYSNNRQQFYIRGVNTDVVVRVNCSDWRNFGLFTNVTFHKEFILNIIDQQLRTDSCPSITLENGQFSVLGQDTPRDSILNNNVVNLTCNANHTLHPANSLVVCASGNWSVPIPQCKLTCPPTISRSVDVTCTVDGNPVDCKQPLVEGAVARSKCKVFYAKEGFDIPISTCIKGSWTDPVVRCVPECGDEISKGVTYIVKGKSAKRGEFPWHIALYRLMGEKHEYKCGGSIINPLIIITAAHCFTDDGVAREPADKFYVGAGKYYSDYNSVEDIQAQKRQVKEYHISTEYRGYDSQYAGDLAVVVVRRAFVMTSVVQPVCVDWDGSMESEHLKQNNTGSVVGWGYVDPNINKESAELKRLNPAFIDRDQCLKEVPSTFRRWVTLDKFCAGFKNGSSVCRGDSGGGLVFKGNNTQNYFIRGVVSVGPVREEATTETCDELQYGVYTKIAYYNNFILNIISTNPVKD